MFCREFCQHIPHLSGLLINMATTKQKRAYKCTWCTYVSSSKSAALRHVYTHVDQETWQYTCPFSACHWFGKNNSEYKLHFVTKTHQKMKEAYPVEDDSEAKLNPNHEFLGDYIITIDHPDEMVSKTTSGKLPSTHPVKFSS